MVSQQLQLLLFKRGIHATSSARFQLLLRASGYWKDGGAQPHNSSPGPATGCLGRKYLVDTEPLKFYRIVYVPGRLSHNLSNTG